MPSARVPSRIEPMLATLADVPFHHEGWLYEEKYDGIRVLAFKNRGDVRLITRNQKDRTRDFPAIVAALARCSPDTLVLDGEVVIFDAKGVSRFQLLQRRALGESEAEPVYVVFDVLYASGRDLRREPLSARRRTLVTLVRGGSVVRRSRILDENGLRAFEIAKHEGLEGLIAKDGRSIYEEGARSKRWLKVKVRREDEFVIGGFTAPQGSRTHFGALLVGAYEGDKLRYAGKVGTGYDRRVLADLARRMQPLVRPTSPFADRVRERGVTWVAPRLVGQFAYAEITRDGQLRQPVFLGLREDKPARKVHWPRSG